MPCPPFILWTIQGSIRNTTTFDQKNGLVPNDINKIISIYGKMGSCIKNKGMRINKYKEIKEEVWLQSGYCHELWKVLHFGWGGGQGTNSKEELISLLGVLIMAKWQRIDFIHIFGDAKSIIDQVQNNTSFSPPILKSQMCRIQVLINTFKSINLDHIYREQSWSVDLLSKRQMSKPTCKFYFSAYEQGQLIV